MRIPRIQSVELEDLAWLPRDVRDGATDYLRFMEERFALHAPAVPLLRDAMTSAGVNRIVDLCSGGAGPVPPLLADLRRQGVEARATLTDRYPNLPAFRAAQREDAAIDGEEEPIDARDVPRRLAGMRTLFNSFHHFSPADAQAILADAVAAGAPIAVFEIPDRRLAAIVGFVTAPLFVMLATPFMRPFRWRRLLWTYVIPGIPLTCLWDGIVSQLRAYTPAELEDLAARTDSPGWRWTAGRCKVPGTPLRMTYLVGVPPRE